MSKGTTDKLSCPCTYECSRNGDCDACIAFCATGAIRREGDRYLRDEEKCIRCSACTIL